MTSANPSHLADQMRAFRALRAMSLWLISGLVLWLGWLFSHDDSNEGAWRVTGAIWLTVSNVSVLAALTYGYWLQRIAYRRRRTLLPFHLNVGGPGFPLLALACVYGFFATLALVRDVDGESPTLFLFTALTFAVAVVTQADWFDALRRGGRKMRQIEEALDEP